MTQFGSGPMEMFIAFVLGWCLILGGLIVLFRVSWRFLRAQERIATALEALAARKLDGL